MPSWSHIAAAYLALTVVMIGAVTAPGAAMAQQSPAAQQAMQACRADYQALCSDVQPGGGRGLACLQQHADKVSDGCKQALASLRQK